MGGLVAELNWDQALAGTATLTVAACAHNTVEVGYSRIDRILPSHICNLIIRETAVVDLNGRRHVLGAGSALWINPGVQHSIGLVATDRPFTMLNLRFQLEESSGQTVRFPEPAFFVDDAWDLKPLWELVIDDHGRGRVDRLPRLRHVLALLYGDLRRRHTDGGDGPSGGLGRQRRLTLLDWVEAHLHQRPTPADLAQVVGLSADWFRRAFQRSFGSSPRAWLVQQRMRRAAHLLADNPAATITRVAEMLGYDDYRLLDRQFRSVYGTSPQRWRQSAAAAQWRG